MIRGLGVDVAAIERFRASEARYGRRFAERILTEAELALQQELAAEAQSTFLAGRFAIKEAAYKALGGPRDVYWHQIETLKGTLGEPLMTLSGPARQRAELLGVTRWWVSLSHDGGVAFATVILEGEP